MGMKEQVDVGLDVDGAALRKMFADLDARFATIKKAVDDIGKRAEKAGFGFDAGLNKSLKTLRQIEANIAGVERLANSPTRRPVNTIAETQAFGNRVIKVTQYSRSLREAADAAEKLDVRLNKLNQTAARNGELTPAQMRRVKQLQEEKKEVEALERQYGRLGDKARATGKDFAGFEQRVSAARTALLTATSNPTRHNFQKEIKELKDAQAAYAQVVASAGRMDGGGGGGSKGPHLFGATGLKGVFARTAAYGGAATLLFGAMSTAKQSIQFTVEFEAALKQLQAIAGATTLQMQPLAASILAVGENSRFSLLEITQMATVLAQAGVSVKNMGTVLQAVNNLAVASGSTPDEAVQLVTSALGSFQLQGSEAARVADLMTEALNRTKLTVQQVGQAIQYVGATAFENNIGLDEMLATIGAAAQAGVKSGSTIGTGFRQFLTDLENPSEKMIAVLERFGITEKDIDVKTRGLRAVLDTMKSSGIGSAQAFEMMEKRGAAFYLVAKNNLDIVDQLQIAFTNQNAALKANETAMDSTSAQWKRFVNLLGTRFSEDMKGPLLVIKNILREINSLLAGEGSAAAGPPKIVQQLDNWIQEKAHPFVADLLEETVNKFSIGQGISGGPGLGTWLRSLGQDMSDVTGKAELLATAVNESTEAVAQKADKVSALDKELQRLHTQEEAIRDVQSRVDAETATLGSRFEGLSKHLVGTKMKFDDLRAAMEKLRQEEAGLLSGEYFSQAYNLHAQRADQLANVMSTRKTLQSFMRTGLLKGLSPAEQGAINSPGAPNTPQFMNSAALLQDLATRLLETNRPAADLLNTLASSMRSAVSLGMQEALAKRQGFLTGYKGTVIGSRLENTLTGATGDIEKLNSMEIGERGKAGVPILTAIQGVLDEANRLMNNAKVRGLKPELIAYFGDVIARANEAKKAVNAAMKQTTAESREARKAEREATAAARRVTRADIDEIGRLFNLTPGNGQRPLSVQKSLMASGASKYRGDPAAAPHVQGRARDFPTGNMSYETAMRLAARMQAEADSRYGKGVMKFIVEFPSKNGMGTGNHIHGQVAKDATTSRNAQRDVGGTALDELMDQIKTKGITTAVLGDHIEDTLRDLKYAVNESTFEAAANQARNAVRLWGDALLEKTSDEAARDNATPAETQERLRLVRQQIAAKMQEVQDAIFDKFLKSIDKQLEAIKQSSEANLSPFQRNADIAGARVSGLDLFSVKDKVPDYVRYLAQRKAEQANENLLRAQYTQSGTDLGGMEAALGALRAKRDDLPNSIAYQPQLETLDAQIVKLTNDINELRVARDAMGTSLGAGEQIPQTLGEMTQQAYQAYYAMNNLGDSFEQFAGRNVLDAIGQLQESFSTLFSDILTGSKTVGQAFGDFAKSIMNYIVQLMAKFVAMQAIKMLFSAFGLSLPGGMFGGGEVKDTANGKFHGGYIRGAFRGEHIQDGVPGRDSTLRRLAKGEFVVRKAAVDSVGVDYMRALNERGRQVMRPQPIVMPPPAEQTTNVYVVKENQRPQMGPRDVLVVVADDILRDGQTKKLIKQVSQGA